MVRRDIERNLRVGINTHFRENIPEEITLRFQDQDVVSVEELSQWVEISVFGPFFHQQPGEYVVSLQLQLRCYVRENLNIYDVTDLSGLVSEVATKSIFIGAYDKCLKTLDMRIMPRGQHNPPNETRVTIVQVDYEITIQGE